VRGCTERLGPPGHVRPVPPPHTRARAPSRTVVALVASTCPRITEALEGKVTMKRIKLETLRVIFALSALTSLALVLEAGRRWF
jgi:hypothetical protein